MFYLFLKNQFQRGKFLLFSLKIKILKNPKKPQKKTFIVGFFRFFFCFFGVFWVVFFGRVFYCQSWE
jgi:hypothetical protein